MTAQAIRCDVCSWPLPSETWNREHGISCPGCSARIQVLVFPAMERVGSGAPPEALGEETEASCFYHSRNRAAVVCDECGRFLCKLCELPVDGRHICPTCFDSGLRGRKLRDLDTRRVMYDSIALATPT